MRRPAVRAPLLEMKPQWSEPEAAEFLRNPEPEHAQPAHLLQCFARNEAIEFPLVAVGHNLVRDEVERLLMDGGEIIVELRDVGDGAHDLSVGPGSRCRA